MSNILSPSQKASSAKVRERILVVEYEGFVSMVLSEHLREAGFDVVEAKNADDALSAMEISVPDLIITDVRMPGSMDGLALLAVVPPYLPDRPIERVMTSFMISLVPP